MPSDHRLSNALDRAAGSLPRSAGDWDAVRSAAVRRRHERRAQAGAVLGTAVVVTLGLVFATGNNDDRSIITAPPRSVQVVATIDGRVVVLSGDDGEVVRTLSEGAPDLDATSVTATPDGETVYVQRGTECEGQAPPSIWRLPTRGGPATEIGAGIGPLASPDGRWLAFATSTSEAPGDCGPFDRLVVMRLDGLNPDGSVAVSMDFSPSAYATPIAWSSDSSSLAAFVNEDNEGRGFVTIAVSDKGLAQAGRIAEPSANGLAYLPSGEVISAFPTEPTSRISTFDPETGEEQRVVAEISEPLYLIDVDRSGTAFLLEGPLADTVNGHDLYRAEVGSPDPVKLAEHVNDAVWLSSASRPSAEIAAAIGDKLVVLSADDGRIVRTLATAPLVRTIGSISASPDGRDVYYSLFDSYCGLPTEIWRVASDDAGEPIEVALGGLPLVSPDGRWLAFAERLTLDHPCLYDVDLVVRDLTTGEEIRFPVPGGGFVEPVAWYPDSTKLVGRRMGSDIERPLDVTLEVLPSGLSELSTVNNQVQSYAFLPSGEAVTANPLHTAMTSSVATFNPTTEDAGRTITEIDRPGFIDLVDVDATGSRFLLFHANSQSGPVNRDRNLFRADLGEPMPVKLAEHVNDAIWLPSSSTTTPTTTADPSPPPRPDSIIAGLGNSIVELDSETGDALRIIADASVGSGVSLNPDRTKALVAVAVADPCDDAGTAADVAMLDVSTGGVQALGFGSATLGGGNATISPDGNHYAYVARTCDFELNPYQGKQLVVRDFAGVAERVFVIPESGNLAETQLGSVAWDSDSQHLLVTVAREPTGNEFLILDTATTPGVHDLDGVSVPQLGDDRGPFDIRPLGNTGRWIATLGALRDGPLRLVEYDIVIGAVGRTLFSWPDAPADFGFSIGAADASGQHLLLLGHPNGGPATLYRWSAGEARPTMLVEGVEGADW